MHDTLYAYISGPKNSFLTLCLHGLLHILESSAEPAEHLLHVASFLHGDHSDVVLFIHLSE